MTTTPSTGTGSELKWYKSSYSTNDGPACVEVASTCETIHVRDSKNKLGPQLAFGPSGWAMFVSYAADH